MLLIYHHLKTLQVAWSEMTQLHAPETNVLIDGEISWLKTEYVRLEQRVGIYR